MYKLILFILFLFIGACNTNDKSFVGDNKITFSSFNKLPIVEGKINGLKAFFIVDSGASISVLDEKQSTYFNFTVGDSKGEAAGYGGKAVFSQVFDARLEIGNVIFVNEYMCQDLSLIVRTMKQSEGIVISGIIGSDVMRDNNFIINYSENTITIGK